MIEFYFFLLFFGLILIGCIPALICNFIKNKDMSDIKVAVFIIVFLIAFSFIYTNIIS